MNLSERRVAVDYYKGYPVVLTLVSGQRLPVGIYGTDEDNAICIPKAILQSAYDKKQPLAEIFSDKKNHEYIPLNTIDSISPF